MCKRFIGLVVALLSTLSVLSQEKISVLFVNQYDEPLNTFSVTNGGEAVTYVADDKGVAELTLVDTDPVVIHIDGYEPLTTSVASLKANHQATVQKKFGAKDLLNPMFYIKNGGLWLILFIVFAETGLFAGFFLPGDSLLFVAGIYSSDLMREFYKTFGVHTVQNEWLDLFVLVAGISLMGILGNMLGYWMGKKIGPSMFNWKDRFLFKKKYLHDAHEFFEKHGGGAIVFARFLPVVRSFAPIVAGIVNMDRKKFMLFNIIGSFVWVFSLIFAGHFLQIWVRNQFGFELREHLEVIVLTIVLVTTTPVLWKLIFGKSKTPPPIE